MKGNGLAGMLEDEYIHTIKECSLTIAVIVKTYCDKEHDAPVTDLFIRYIELSRLAYGTSVTVGCTDDDADVLRKKIVKFKDRGIEVLVEYQLSGMKRLKWHLLNHLAGDMKKFWCFSLWILAYTSTRMYYTTI